MKKFALMFLVACLVLTSAAAFAETKTIKLAHLNPQQPFEVATAAMGEELTRVFLRRAGEFIDAFIAGRPGKVKKRASVGG